MAEEELSSFGIQFRRMFFISRKKLELLELQ